MPSSNEGLEFLKEYTLKEIEWYYYERLYTIKRLQELSCPAVIISIRMQHALSVRDYVHNGGEFHVGEPREIFACIEEQDQYPDEYELRRRKRLDPELDFYYRNNHE